MVYLDILFQIMVYVFYLIMGFVINLFCVSIFKKATYLPFIISGIAFFFGIFPNNWLSLTSAFSLRSVPHFTDCLYPIYWDNPSHLFL